MNIISNYSEFKSLYFFSFIVLPFITLYFYLRIIIMFILFLNPFTNFNMQYKSLTSSMLLKTSFILLGFSYLFFLLI